MFNDVSMVFVFILFIGIIFVGVIVAYLQSPKMKGHYGEWLVRLCLWFGLNDATYRAIHNVTLATVDGTTQIDHVILSRYGIFVIETKNLKGWIFGQPHQKKWTQQIYRKRSSFQNPLHQNYKHMKALGSSLKVAEEQLFSLVVFTGRSTFKTNMPTNVTSLYGMLRFIKAQKKQLVTESEVNAWLNQIESMRKSPSRQTDAAHVAHLKRRETGTDGVPDCPRCGAEMILRTAKRGPHAGQTFWGCSRYPDCKQTVAAS